MHANDERCPEMKHQSEKFYLFYVSNHVTQLSVC